VHCYEHYTTAQTDVQLRVILVAGVRRDRREGGAPLVAGVKAVLPSSSAASEEAASTAAWKVSSAAEEEEKAFEDTLTDEQLREVVP
jgi:hypothetical protein